MNVINFITWKTRDFWNWNASISVDIYFHNNHYFDMVWLGLPRIFMYQITSYFWSGISQRHSLKWLVLSWHFFVQSQQRKHQNNVRNQFKVYNYNKVFIVNSEQISPSKCRLGRHSNQLFYPSVVTQCWLKKIVSTFLGYTSKDLMKLF